MKIPLFRNGKPAGYGDVPDDIVEAAQRVRHWMNNNNVTLICGLSAVGPSSGPVADTVQKMTAAHNAHRRDL